MPTAAAGRRARRAARSRPGSAAPPRSRRAPPRPSTSLASCERRPTTGFTNQGPGKAGGPSSGANRGVASGTASRWIARDVGFTWHARTDAGLGPGSPRRSATIAASSAERSFVPTMPSAGSAASSSTSWPGSASVTSRSGPEEHAMRPPSRRAPPRGRAPAARRRSDRPCRRIFPVRLDFSLRWPARTRRPPFPRSASPTSSRPRASATLSLLEPFSDEELARQVSAIMSPLVWDLAHIGHFEELWLSRRLGGRAADAFGRRRSLRRFRPRAERAPDAATARPRSGARVRRRRARPVARRCSTKSSSTPTTRCSATGSPSAS